MEKPIIVERDNMQMVGMLHLPGEKEKVPGVVMYHGFTGHKLESHRMFVKMARSLADAGIAALRCDFIGSGDSEGDFADMTVSQEVADGLAILDYMKGLPQVDPGRIGILGFSLGGAIAALVAGRRSSELTSLALWAPVAKFDLFFAEEQWLKELDLNGQVDLGGNLLKKGFYDDLANHRPLESIRAYHGPILFVHGTADEAVSLEHSELYQKAAPGQTRRVTVAGANHTFACTKWEQQAISTTTEWFVQTL